MSTTEAELVESKVLKRPEFKMKYDNYIGGKFIAPVLGKYFDVVSPIDGKVFTQVAHSTKEDIALAVDTAYEAFKSWKNTSATERSIMLNKIADRIEQNLEYIASVETVDNGKAVRETLAADIPLAIDHFRYFASVIRSEEGSHNELDKDTVSLIVNEPLGVVAQIIPWNFPILMAVWKLAPALAAGNCVVLKPAESTPVSIMILMELIGDLIPDGVVNIVNGFGAELGRVLVTNPKVSKAAFTGSTATGRMVMQYATENIIPVTLELGGKSPNIFFNSVMDADDEFLDKAIEGAVLFALNQGEICTCPSRLLVQEDIYDAFIERVIDRVEKIKVGNPLDPTVMMGAQASQIQKDKILSYINLGKEEGAEVLTGGDVNNVGEGLENGYYIQPTLFRGNNKMRIFQEEIFGPVLAVTTFKDEEEAIAIANDTMYGLGAGVWTRDAHQLYQIPRAVQAGRVWVNQYHSYPAGAPFGGYKQSGIGRENHKMMLDHYRQTKNMLISYNKNKLGFF
ncbi:aldehyde dehydrogenase [Elizabethkingia meningoseptica]|uniref:aldehyde dehydrogenase family protein n=1 Tax=Elizabethkingia meningoseptica TaxID=238 RepID=UPI0023B0CF10|nr:aldehyde dehydrogenase family protein [Elizabethkingia meningoseptica]MDE5438726.1 aldehyde dehydrogenase [Elizabethkingia meningoseptica]MDE5507861.1 aldehyde dehydrogenase [Elizabethkingia meningoseptica]MDE5516295.1 aldehyde dehydrogenase [Elizabethkingia meningoseptica]MDE5526536.1 aldehyde dehydrogenase [Elizabethkingia meningoseptica]MDE5530604.1 aldehyde dehydrogenase [Elizabethkingia meningoseptica]